VTAVRLAEDSRFMRLALRLAARARGFTSPNPLVGAVLVRRGRILGQGWHHRAGEPHAEIEALRDAARRGFSARGATLYVTLEPCCTHGRTPPCTEAILAAGIRRVVAAATDPNPRHAGRGFDRLRAAGLRVETGLFAAEAARLNEAFNHWIVHGTPWVTLKCAMTLDGKIATATGESRWITGPAARARAQQLRLEADAVLVGVNTVLADDPALTVRRSGAGDDPAAVLKPVRRLVLDARARTPLTARLVGDAWAAWTTVFVSRRAPARRVAALARRVRVVAAPEKDGRLDLDWILRRLGREGVTHLLVEGGGEVNASFFAAGRVHRVVFFYAPKVLGGRAARKAVAGEGFRAWPEIPRLRDLEWRRAGEDLWLTARVGAA
jgi:diaminohydroxyphosphoribosylaminopyrimidine deaminase/5-amino-6-(5-phosphoribosylamino)uracil reductase